ncbi:M48 family metallopeptidase [Telluribacter sp. SYSU D00476]|uniref:M48 family metallopeptidase n=1 Tax=Telluribacter sp. SYSU D00476 TaxID=2811430 RepID=UPI001FF54837|nr:M48 family metallopeptidase [Telluribacter sp. SYSU D00476]
MKRIFFAALASLLFVVGCQRVPLTGRNQLMLVGSKELLPMSFQSYRQLLDTSQVVGTGPNVESVRRVGQKIQRAVEDYLRDNNQLSLVEGFQWEYNVINSPQINAFCMPGGKVAFYTGILPICQNDEGIAVVMGHEIAHAIANHGAERMSQGLLSQGVLTAGQIGLGVAMSNKPQQTQQIYNNLFGLAAPAAATIGYILPNSRNQESEADHLGLIFMAKAGYDPRESVAFWQRMAQASSGQRPPEFLSTHPAETTRIRNLNRLIPKAMEYYPGQGGRR